MNFRLPFQISRVSAICQSSSAVNLISKFTPIYGNHVKSQNKHKQNCSHYAQTITKQCSYKTFHSPFNIYQQKAFIHDIADTEKAVKQWVRYQQNCDCQYPEEPELAFRQTSKIKCFPCIEYKPCIAPPIGRPLKLYDDSKCLYDHKHESNVFKNNPPRMDNVCCLQVVKKNLPRLEPSPNCCYCMGNKPLIAPRLCPPPKFYDPEKLEKDYPICEEPKCIRMDDLCGYKETQKELPELPNNNCKQCLVDKVLTAPELKRLVLRYNPSCMLYPHTKCPCEIEPPIRRDNFCCEPIFRCLPPMPCSNCMPCQPYVPTICPCLKRLDAKYDQSEMQYGHEYPSDPCDTPILRRDNNNNIISVTLTRKKLPRLSDENACKPCQRYFPLTAPELKPPILSNCNMQEEQIREYCVEKKTVRRDGVITIFRTCLPPVPTSDDCAPCLDKFKSSTTPVFVPLKKLYDDTKCKYKHICTPKSCENPPRMDDLCYVETRKKLPKVPDSPDCEPCIHYPKKAPQICRLQKAYDDTKEKYKHPYCPEDSCRTIPRADNITGIKDEVRVLQTYKPLKCNPCLPCLPCKAPKLHRPRARYNDCCMVYDHKNCPVPCEETVFRRDHYLWEEPKKLPEVKYDTICCQPCQVYYPTTAPPLGRPQKLYDIYDPVRYRECPPQCPPRKDDLMCWKPKRKKLPSFTDCDQCCCYSTLSWRNTNNIKRSISSKSHFKNKLFPKTKNNLKHNFSTNHVSNLTKLSEKQNLYKSKNVLKENCNNQQKQTGQSTTKASYVQSGSRYFVVNEPTWKCINVSEEQAKNETIFRKKYDYFIEKWLREGEEQKVKTTPVSNSYKINQEQAYNRFNDNHSKYSVDGLECITPVKFTGYDTSECNDYLCIKKNNKLQPLRRGSAFRFDENIQTSDNISCNKTQIPSKEININLNKNKITTAPVGKESKRQYPFPTIIEENIKKHVTQISNMPTSNCILNLNNHMRSVLFQKISNFFKYRESATSNQQFVDAPKNGPDVIVKGNKFSKEFMTNMCKKYNIGLKLNKVNKGTSKPYFDKKFKNKEFKIKIDKPVCCSSKSASNKSETSTAKTLPKNMKLKVNHIRNFSTNSKVCYKHIDISDEYIGKIYKVKLKKIGVKNLMLEKNDPDKMDEEPHTICYICKVVPRYQPVYDDEPPDIEDVKKINDYKEKRNTIE